MVTRREGLVWAGAAGLGLLLGACSKTESNLQGLMAQVTGIEAGSAAGKPLVVFFDTRCGYCVKLWQTLQPHQGELAMLWVPVAILSKASEHEALAMLASSSPRAALEEHMQNFGRAPAMASQEPSEALRAALAGNRNMLKALPDASESVPKSVTSGPQSLLVAGGAQPWASLQSKLAL